MNDVDCEELKSALAKYMKGKYGQIDGVFFRQIGQGIRNRGFLTPVDLFCVLCWKMWVYEEALDLAFGSITNNSEDKIKQVTRDAFELANKGRIAEAMMKLTQPPEKLYGVKVRTASAILAFCNPNNYPVVDIHSWKALYHEKLREDRPTPKEYEKYVNDVHEIAKKCKMTAHDVDAALWVMGGGQP